MPLFGNRIPEMTTKYKILWFVVDTYHRQRYFFICGCKQTVKIAGWKTRREAAQRSVGAVLSNPRFPFVASNSRCSLPGRFAPDRSRVFYDFLLIERIP
jgi:hypothetical protein